MLMAIGVAVFAVPLLVWCLLRRLHTLSDPDRLLNPGDRMGRRSVLFTTGGMVALLAALGGWLVLAGLRYWYVGGDALARLFGWACLLPGLVCLCLAVVVLRQWREHLGSRDVGPSPDEDALP
jgi:uncharacterized membrane protein YqgA involved in biofilm formation